MSTPAQAGARDSDAFYGPTAEDYRDDLLAGELTYPDVPLPTDLPPPPAKGEMMMVNTSLRLPVPVFNGVKALADARGIKFTHMLRQWIEAELESAESGAPVTREEVLRAVEVLRKLGRAA